MAFVQGSGGGGGGVDTEIRGRPGSVSSAATWLRSTAAPCVDDGAAAVGRARTEAQSDWAGDAGPAFAEKMSGARAKVVSFGTAVETMAGTFEDFAGSLRSCQSRMDDVRSTARSAGLTVSGTMILDPGPGPARPPDRSGEEMPIAELEAYEADVRAYNRHQDLVRAFGVASTSAGEVRTDLTRAEQKVVDDYNGMDWSAATTTATDWVSGLALHRLSLFQATALRGIADDAAANFESWRRSMAQTDYRALQRLEARQGPSSAQRAYARDAAVLDDLLERQHQSARTASAFDEGGRYSGVARNVSRGLVGVGVVVDLANGESVPQALTSNVGGYAAGAAATTAVTAGSTWLASTAAGAAIGTAVPIPVVGTVVGAAVGLGVGLFASGAIDSLFTNGPDVGAALDAGAEAVTDTVGAVGEGLEAAGDFVGGLFD